MRSDKKTAQVEGQGDGARRDTLMVNSVEKTFRVLRAFDGTRSSLSLSEVAAAAQLDLSAAQRFTHTLEKLGYLSKDTVTRRLQMTAKVLDLSYHYLKATAIVERSMPYLQHLSKTTEETVNLTILEETDIIFVARFMSRHVLNTDVVIGTRIPAYCTAPGIAILACLPDVDAKAVLQASDLKPYTPHTTWKIQDLLEKITLTKRQGYATQCEEYYLGDMSVASAIVNAAGFPVGSINIAVSKSRYSFSEMIEKYSSLVIAASHSISQTLAVG